MAIAIQMPNGSGQNDIVEEGRLRQMPKNLMEIRVTEVWQSEFAALGKNKLGVQFCRHKKWRQEATT